MKNRNGTTVCLATIVLLSLLVVSMTMEALAGDFNYGTTSSYLKFYDNNGNPLRTYTLKDTDRTLDGTGLVGTVVDGGDHWIVNVYGGTLAGSIYTQTGLEICLGGGKMGISTSRAATSICGQGGVRICGPGVLHIDQNKNYNAINGGKGGVTITLGAVVGINSLSGGTAISGEGLRVLASALHVNAVDGTGIVCDANGDVKIGGSIVTVGATKEAIVHYGKGNVAISGSSVHLISGKQSAIRCGYQDYQRGATNISVANSVFCALGAKHGIHAWYYGTDFWFDNVVGTIAGNDCGIYNGYTMAIDGASTKLVIAGNLSGKHSPNDFDPVAELASNNTSGEAIRMADHTKSYFELDAGSVKLFSPGSCALVAGTNAVVAGKLEIPSSARYSDFRTLFTWQGAIAAAETFVGRSLFQTDSIFADFDITQAFAGVVTPTVALFSLSDARPFTGVKADVFYVSGGEVSVNAAGVGMLLGAASGSKCGYFLQEGGKVSIDAGRVAIADGDAARGYTSSKSDNSGFLLSGGRLTARGKWDGILMDGSVLQEGGTLEAAATGGYTAGTISSKPGLRGYALSANKGFGIDGGSFVASAGALRTTPYTSSAHNSTRVYPCDLAVSGTGAVSISGMKPSWYGVNDLYPVGGKLRFWLPVGSASLKYGGVQYTANGTGKVVAGSNVFRTGSVQATTLTLAASSRSFTAAAASSKELGVTANVAWSAKSSASWLTVKTASGKGNGKIVYNVAANTGSSSRTAKITVTGGGLTRTFTATQSGRSGGWTATLALGSSSRNFTANVANGKELAVTANVSWTAKPSVSWLSLKTAKGSGNGTIVYDVSANTGFSSRKGKITVSGGNRTRTFTVTQEGKPPTVAVGSSGTWKTGTWSVGSWKAAEKNLIRGKNPSKVAGNKYAGCETADAPSRLTDGSVASSDLKGYYEIGNGTTLTYALGDPAVISEFRFYSAWRDHARNGVNVSSIEVSGNGTSWKKLPKSSVNVKSSSAQRHYARYQPDSCINPKFVRIHFGNHDFAYTGYAEIEVIGKKSTVTKVLALASGSRKFTSAAAASKTLEVTADVSWTAKSGVSWIKVKKGSGTGSGKIVYDVAANPATTSRTGKITVTGGGLTKTFTVTQERKPAAAVVGTTGTWKTGTWTDSAWKAAEKNLVRGKSPSKVAGNKFAGCETADAPSRLTDGSVASTDLKGYYEIGNGTTLTYTLDAQSVISEFRFYSAWRDHARNGVNVSSIEVSGDGSSWKKLPKSSVNVSSSSAKRHYAHFSCPGACYNTRFVRIHFGNHDYPYTGYAEIEVIGKKATTTTVLALASASRSFKGASAASKTLDVAANVSWTAKSGVSWITVKKGKGTGNGSVVYDVAANPGFSSRKGTVTVSGGGLTRTFTVTQEGKVPTVVAGSSGTWKTGTWSDGGWNAAEKNLIRGKNPSKVAGNKYAGCETADAPSRLTDGSIASADLKGYYEIGNGTALTYALGDPAVVSEIRFYAAWRDHARNGVNVSSIEVSGDGTSWKTLPDSSVNVKSSSAKRHYAYYKPDSCVNPKFVRIHFGNHDYPYTGYAEIEVLGTKSTATKVLALSAGSRSFTAASAVSKELEVTADVSWTAKSGVSWIKVKKGSGTGSGRIVYDVAANGGTASRTGKITVTGGGFTWTFTVTQSGQAVKLVLSADSRSFTSSAAVSKELGVTANVSWTAKPGVSWITVKKGTGTGSGTVVYDVAANTEISSRTGTLTVSGGGLARTFTVTQDGKPPTVVVGSTGSWKTGTWTDSAWKAAAKNLIRGKLPSKIADNKYAGCETADAPSRLTDGTVASSDLKGYYEIGNGTSLTYALGEPAVISEFRFYAAWRDHARNGVNVSAIEVSGDGTTWKTLPNSSVNVSSSSAKRHYAYYCPASCINPKFVRIHFGNHDYLYTGYAEIEILGTNSTARAVRALATDSRSFTAAAADCVELGLEDDTEADSLTASGGPDWNSGEETSGEPEEAGQVWVTTSDGSNGDAVVDGDENTGWSPSGTGGAWVALTFEEPQDIAGVVVKGDELPEGIRALVSEDGDDWSEEGCSAASYLWVILPDEGSTPNVTEIEYEP